MWNSLISVLKHGDESNGRFKMRLIKRFLGLKLSWIYFLYKLGEFGDKTQQLVKDLTEFGEAWIDQTQTLRKAWNQLESWINQFVGSFKRKLSHIMFILIINNLPLKFGSKRSTLKIWVFRAWGLGFWLSPLDQELILDQNYHGLFKFYSLIRIHSKWRTKHINRFENIGVLIFS